MLGKLGIFPRKLTVLMHNHFLMKNAKMSKSLGNVVCPFSLIEEIGLEPVRFYFLAFGPQGKDAEFDKESVNQRYIRFTADKLINSILRVSAKKFNSDNSFNRIDEFSKEYEQKIIEFEGLNKDIDRFMADFNFVAGFAAINAALDKLSVFIQESQFWKDKNIDFSLFSCFVLEEIKVLLFYLQVYLPETSKKCQNYLGFDSLSSEFRRKGLFYKVDHSLRDIIIIKK